MSRWQDGDLTLFRMGSKPTSVAYAILSTTVGELGSGVSLVLGKQ